VVGVLQAIKVFKVLLQLHQTFNNFYESSGLGNCSIELRTVRSPDHQIYFGCFYLRLIPLKGTNVYMAKFKIMRKLFVLFWFVGSILVVENLGLAGSTPCVGCSFVC